LMIIFFRMQTVFSYDQKLPNYRFMVNELPIKKADSKRSRAG
jgi:hypothetical protein